MKSNIISKLPLLLVLSLCSLNSPVLGEWLEVKAKGVTNSAYMNTNKICKSNNFNPEIFGALVGAAIGREVSKDKAVGITAGAATGALVGHLLKGGCISKISIGLDNPSYKYPELWSFAKAKGKKNSAPFYK